MIDGKEIMDGEFGVDANGNAMSTASAKTKHLKVIPHYQMRQLTGSFTINDPHSDMGKFVTLP